MQNLETASHGLEARKDLHGETEKSSKETKLDTSENEDKLSKEQVSRNSKRAWQLGREFAPCKCMNLYFVDVQSCFILMSLLYQTC
jgi:hypothetical protein